MWSQICSSSKHSKFLIVIQPLFALAHGLPSLLVTGRAGTAERDRILLRPACPVLVTSLVFSGNACLNNSWEHVCGYDPSIIGSFLQRECAFGSDKGKVLINIS